LIDYSCPTQIAAPGIGARGNKGGLIKGGSLQRAGEDALDYTEKALGPM